MPKLHVRNVELLCDSYMFAATAIRSKTNDGIYTALWNEFVSKMYIIEDACA